MRTSLTASVRRAVAAAGRASAAAALVLPAAAGASDDAALSEHRALWESAGVADYEYAFQKQCECHGDSPPATRVEVRGGEIVGVAHRPAGDGEEIPAEPRSYEWYWTVDGLFDLIATGLARDAEVRADYDAGLGHPTRIYVDYDGELIGDEVDLRVTRLEALAD